MRNSPRYWVLWGVIICSTLGFPFSTFADAPSANTTQPTQNFQSLSPTGARAQHYGIAAHPWWLKLQLDNFVKYYKDLQVGVIRLPIEWKTLEPSSGNYDWTLNDRLLNRLNDEGFEIIGEFVTVPLWASSNPDICAKSDVQCAFKTDQSVKDHLSAMTSALVKRYPYIRMWEFWNEPEQWPNAGKNVADYAPFLYTFYNAAKQADPYVMVAASTLAGFDYMQVLYNYFDAYYSSDKKPWDAISCHPYNLNFQLDPDGSISPINKATLEKMRELMVIRGDGNKPIWVTEIGWQDTPQAQAVKLKDALNWLDQRPYVTIVVVHLLNDWNDEVFGLMQTVPNIYHTNLQFTANTVLVPKQPFYDTYKYYLKRSLPQISNTVTDTLSFPATLHSVQGPFVTPWQSGGLELFGLPKTGQFYEENPADGHYYLVQYFERVRMEYHPDSKNVQFGLLGNQLLIEHGWLDENGVAVSGPALPEAKPADSSAMYFEETKHAISGQFLDAWKAHGGLSIVGLPKTSVFEELNPDDGQTYQVQYFERARMELHPTKGENVSYITFGLLGNDRLRLQNRLDKNNYPNIYDFYNPALPEFGN